MKRVYIFAIFFTCSLNVYAKQIILNIPDEEIQIVEQDVVSAEQWIRNAWAGKVNNCKSRIVQKEVQISIQKNEAIPAGEDAIVEKYLDRPEALPRKDRELDQVTK